jgi:UDP-N-acetylglucosamine--N-acetylmuramyl-(pentapeptide) pyrophosphoryl-undecaprenol N-acetylglucosamine transferase
MKILITGGHLSPALAVIDEISRRYGRNHSLVFIGRKYTDMAHKDVSLEYQEITKRQIHFTHLDTGRLTWLLSLRTLLQFIRIGKGIILSWQILSLHKPDVVMSFGGYIALPVAFVAWIKRIPVHTHEQTMRPGLANKLIALIARTVFISFPETEAYFSPRKTIVSGNPIRSAVFQNQTAISVPHDVPVLYITGGSLGSHSVNEHIRKIINELLMSFVVIHQTGDVTEYDDYTKLLLLKQSLPQNLQERYYLTKFVPTDQIGWVLDKAEIIVGRSGANTFFELIALKKPSVLIPLPWSSHGEQEAHAQILQHAGVSTLFYQTDSTENLLSSIQEVYARRNGMDAAFSQLQKTYIHEAPQIITRHICEEL